MKVHGRHEVIIATPPAFMSQQQAGRYLGHCADWLRKQAKRHPLYASSTGVTRQGSAAKYHIEHIRIIEQHILHSAAFTEDDAYRKWCSKKGEMLNGIKAPARQRKQRKAKR